MELFEYWWEESQQYKNPGTIKEIAKEAWEAAKNLHGKAASQPSTPEDVEYRGHHSFRCPYCNNVILQRR